ncbi:MAG: COR domain-containing protein, partial [Methylomonas sp.]
MSSNSVYVLVLTGREDAQKSDADYWLRLIRAFANDTDGNIAPVIVALNKWEEHPFKLDRNLLKEKYPFIVDFIETDCRTGLGIDSLKAKLAKTVEPMDIVRRPFKLSWWNIKEQLEKAQRKKNYLPYSEFQATCAKLGEADSDGQRILAEVFHALGIALNYGQDERLRNSTVLNPRWVTDGIYTLLRAVPDDGSAELTLERVRQVLPKEPDEMRFYLIELMRRFDLAFPLNETGDRWLVPQRLPAEQPELGTEWKAAQDITRLQYRYPVIPEGLMPRFITRSYPLSEGEEDGEPLPCWVNGVILEDRGARALVRVDEE